MYTGEIRQSEIDDLLDKVRERKYGQYLLRLTLANARGFENQSVSFDFPVTALIGPNGGGKTTVLGAAACAYKSIQPRRFFAKSGKFDDSMANWRFEYDAIDRNVSKTGTARRTASFKRARWNRDALTRPVLVFGVTRTVPASERTELRRYASNKFTVPISHIASLGSEVATAVQKILGKDVSEFSRVAVDGRGNVTLLTGQTGEGSTYSEFHFGAGESSVIRMVAEIEAMDDNGLVLIEEIENGLHPVATRRMVEYLIDVAKRKTAQVVFTTHSNDALTPLPATAIWSTLDHRVIQGKLDIRSLRAITGQVQARLVIFVEDVFAREWTRATLRFATHDRRIALDAIEIHEMQGDGTAVKVHQHHQLDPSANQTSVCLLDGDSSQDGAPDRQVFKFPGQNPERHVAAAVIENIEEVSAELAASLHVPVEQQRRVIEVVKEVSNTNRDPHLLFAQIGKKLGLISESVVRSAFLAQWAQLRAEEVDDLLDGLDQYLPRESVS